MERKNGILVQNEERSNVALLMGEALFDAAKNLRENKEIYNTLKAFSQHLIKGALSIKRGFDSTIEYLTKEGYELQPSRVLNLEQIREEIESETYRKTFHEKSLHSLAAFTFTNYQALEVVLWTLEFWPQPGIHENIPSKNSRGCTLEFFHQNRIKEEGGICI